MKQSKRERMVIRNMQENKNNHRQYTPKGIMKEWIQELEGHIHCDDFEEVQEQVICKVEEAGHGINAIKPLLLFMERHPFCCFGMPGAIVHYVEQFYKKGYEELLISSLRRRPTLHTVWMLNRIKNTGENREYYEHIFQDMLEKQELEEEIKTSIREFL